MQVYLYAGVKTEVIVHYKIRNITSGQQKVNGDAPEV